MWLHQDIGGRPTSATFGINDVPRYFYYFMRLWIGTGIFEVAKGGSTIPHLTGETLRASRFPSPPREEQHAIAVHLDTLGRQFDTLTAEAERAIGLLQERRTALISAAVTGKIDVRGISDGNQQA